MYETIIVPLDGSELAEETLLCAQGIASRFKSEIDLVTVVEPPGEQERVLGVYLEKIAGELASKGVKARSELLYGNAAEEIVNRAEKTKSGLIIMGTHGRSGLGRWAMGSVVSKVLDAATIPVLLMRSGQCKVITPEDALVEEMRRDSVVQTGEGLVCRICHLPATRLTSDTCDKCFRKWAMKTRLSYLRAKGRGKVISPEAPPFRRILVPLDGSPIGAAALPYVEELAAKTGASVLLLQVVQIPLTLASDSAAFIDTLSMSKMVEALEKEAKAYLAKIAAGMQSQNIITSSTVKVGPVAETILDFAHSSQNLDLIAMSTHGRSGISRWVFGSVAQKVVQGAELPTLIIRARK